MSFINIFFLGAIGAVALPVLFHFVRKIRARPVVFSSLMFLSETPKERVRRRRLRDVLLLTLRALVLALLALAFARPYIPVERLPFVSTEENESVVYLFDASYSMQADGVADAARSEVLRRIDASRPGDEVAVISFSDHAEQLTELGADVDLQRTVVSERTAVSNRVTDFFEPLRVASEVLRTARHESRSVVLVSDLQRSGWTGSLENWNLDAGVGFYPIRIGPDEAANRWFGDVAARVRTSGENPVIQFDGRVESAAEGDAAVGPTSVTLTVGGRVVESTRVDPGTSGRFSLRHVSDRGGFLQGRLALDEDALAVDNDYYFTVEVEERPSVLVVDPSPRVAGGLIRSDGYFLEKAFAPAVRDEDLQPFEVEVRGRDRLRAIPQSTEVVFAANLPSLLSNEVAAIRRYVEDGGNVVISFGDNTNAAAYSRSLEELGIGSVDGVATPRLSQGGNSVVGQVDWRHPVFAPFAGPGGGAILRPEFRRYAILRPSPTASVVATFDSGDPFLVERRIGRGSVMVFASTFGNAWTDLPINELFVPLVHQLARHATSDHRRRLMYTVGDNVALIGTPGSTWEVRTPRGDVFRATGDSTGVAWFVQTEDVGHYVAARGSDRFPFSVNLDRAESNLTPRDEAEAYASVVLPAAEQPDRANEAALTVESEEKEQKLWRWFLLAALVAYAFETVLANRHRRNKRG